MDWPKLVSRYNGSESFWKLFGFPPRYLPTEKEALHKYLRTFLLDPWLGVKKNI